MGKPKEWLPLGDETMLERVVRVVGEVVSPVVVVGAAGQRLPELPTSIEVVCDRQPDRGPLEGLAVGLAALPAEIEAAFVTTVDAPLLTAAFVRRMIELFTAAPPETQVIAPRIEGRMYPLTAIYRRSILSQIEEALAADRLRVTDLLAASPAKYVVADELREADPAFLSLTNINDPSGYDSALRIISKRLQS
jgi:molybdopterin-guanine dinucleotide biosynthesis protein A